MKIDRLDRAISLIRAYKPSATVDFEHDEIYVDGPAPEDMRPDECAKVEEQGFKYDRSLDRWRAGA